MKPLLVLAASLTLSACGGSEPHAAAPQPPATTAPAAPAPSAAEQEPAQAPRQVSVKSIKVDGGGIEEKDVRVAHEARSAEYEKCFARGLEAAPDAGGGAFVTYLYMKAERKSVSASYSGPGADVLNNCLYEAAAGAKLAPAASAERTVITIELDLAKSK